MKIIIVLDVDVPACADPQRVQRAMLAAMHHWTWRDELCEAVRPVVQALVPLDVNAPVALRCAGGAPCDGFWLRKVKQAEENCERAAEEEGYYTG